jgi:hypothetical protein
MDLILLRYMSPCFYYFIIWIYYFIHGVLLHSIYNKCGITKVPLYINNGYGEKGVDEMDKNG